METHACLEEEDSRAAATLLLCPSFWPHHPAVKLCAVLGCCPYILHACMYHSRHMCGVQVHEDAIMRSQCMHVEALKRPYLILKSKLMGKVGKIV